MPATLSLALPGWKALPSTTQLIFSWTHSFINDSNIQSLFTVQNVIQCSSHAGTSAVQDSHFTLEIRSSLICPNKGKKTPYFILKYNTHRKTCLVESDSSVSYQSQSKHPHKHRPRQQLGLNHSGCTPWPRLPPPQRQLLLFNGLPSFLSGWRICLQCRKLGFDSWVGKIPWRRKWQSTPVFLPGESPWTEEPGRLHGVTRVGHDRVTFTLLHFIL